MAQGLLLVETYRIGELSPIAKARVTITSQEDGEVREARTNENGQTGLIALPAPPRAASLTPDSTLPFFYRYTVLAQADGYVSVRVVGVQLFPEIESIVPIHMAPRGQDSVPAVATVPSKLLPTEQTTQDDKDTAAFFLTDANDEPEVVIHIPENAVMDPMPRIQPGPSDFINLWTRNIQPGEEVQNVSPAQRFDLANAPQAVPYEINIPPSVIMQNEWRFQQGPMDDVWQSAGSADLTDAIPVLAPAYPAERPRDVVFIPETITIHLGRPREYARDVTVSFLDYIKNVASSEIFPTWPENALRANIHAQVGFTLNRIYTEWYRSRGYQFDITNTTAYDQAFVEGRNIFENISRLVDEIFNVYPRREGRRNPLFSSFCNGTTSQCDGLSQWGSVSLANEGYTPLGILQYYYGNNVELVRTYDIRGNTGSYPGEPLRLGSRGEAVRSIQRQLLRISRNFPYIPVISTATGYFSESTEAAVRAFQEVFNQNPDGVVGPSTWYEINRVFTGITALGELHSEGVPLPGAIVPYPGTALTQGMWGEDVRILQRYLNDLASVYGALPAVLIDGIFGPGTVAAVVAFQRLFSLTPDGVVGPETWEMLMLVWNNSFY